MLILLGRLALYKNHSYCDVCSGHFVKNSVLATGGRMQVFRALKNPFLCHEKQKKAQHYAGQNHQNSGDS
jgi:hypothetical protein